MPRSEPPSSASGDTTAESSAPPAVPLLSEEGAGEEVSLHQRLSFRSGEVASWLLSHGLDTYTTRLIEAGYTRLVLFSGMDESEMETVISDNKMPLPHARAFKSAVQELRLAPAPASVSVPQVLPSSMLPINDSLEVGLLTAAPIDPVVVQALPVPTSAPASGQHVQTATSNISAGNGRKNLVPGTTLTPLEFCYVVAYSAFFMLATYWVCFTALDPFLDLMCGSPDMDAQHCTKEQRFHFPPASDSCWSDYTCKGKGIFPCCGASCKLPYCGCTLCDDDGSNQDICDPECQKKDACPDNPDDPLSDYCSHCCTGCGQCCVPDNVDVPSETCLHWYMVMYFAWLVVGCPCCILWCCRKCKAQLNVH